MIFNSAPHGDKSESARFSQRGKSRRIFSAFATSFAVALGSAFASPSALAASASSATTTNRLPTTPNQLPSAGRQPVYHINPSLLRQQVLSRDTSVRTGLDNVYQAKEKLNIARGNMLPSLNLSVIFSGSPTFLLAEVQYLLPFLLPSNWFNLRSSEHQLAASGYAFYVLELNEFASAYSAYQTVVRDMGLRDILQEQYAISLRVVRIVTDQVTVGEALRSDLQQATAQAELAKVQVSQINEMVAQEMAAIRKLITMPLDQPIAIDPATVAASRFEGASTLSAAQYAYDRAPERFQVESLVRASQSNTGSAAFAFINGAGLSSTSSVNGGGLGNVTPGISVSIGFTQYPAVKLNQVNTDFYRSEAFQIQTELSRIIETSIESIKEAKQQVALATDAELNYRKVLTARLQEYGLGQTDLLHVLTAQKDVSTASVTRVRAQLDLDTQRINLHRSTIGDEFAAISDCNLKETNGGGWLQGLFAGPSSEMHTIDQICRATPDQIQR